MKNNILLTLLILIPVALMAQKKEQWFDYWFKPTNNYGRYFVTTEKKDALWHRQGWFVPEKSMAMEGWYKDEECKIPHGEVTWYHTSKYMESKITYDNGKKQGLFLRLDEQGNMVDSGYYENDRLKGVRLGWYSDGMLSDSMNFDGNGNGVEIGWYNDGNVAFAGYFTSDTIKKGRWKYYHNNGAVKATIDFINGKEKALACYDENGNQLDSLGCVEKEATFPGDAKGWQNFVMRNLNANVPSDNAAPDGSYTVVVQFIVNTDGTITDLRPITSFGYGMEEETIRLIKNSPKWIPAQQYGRKVKAYRRQPVTFVISSIR